MYDFAIIGGGVAGFSAAIYAQRFEIKTVVFSELDGGTITQTHLVENWPGEQSISGFDLGMKVADHARSLGVEIRPERVTELLRNEDETFTLRTGKGEITAKSVLVATGTHHRHLGVPGEKELANRGVSYCATCDGPFFKGKTVAIVGGSDSAVKESLLLAQHAAKVYVIYRGEQVRAEPINIKRMEANEKIELITKTNIVEICGEMKLEKVKFDTGKELLLDGLFIEIGRLPNSDLVKELGVELNERGEIKIDRVSRTNIPGLFAAGDITDTDWKQAITGSGEGCHAAHQAFEYVQSA